jgi:p-aminobenzoyl-glutamate transporter AbgT
LPQIVIFTLLGRSPTADPAITFAGVAGGIAAPARSRLPV